MLEGERAVFVDQVVATHRLRAVSASGDSFPLHASANGKAFLASLPEVVVTRVLSGRLEASTPHTLTAADDLLAASIPVPSARFVGREEELHKSAADFVVRISEAIAGRSSD